VAAPEVASGGSVDAESEKAPFSTRKNYWYSRPLPINSSLPYRRDHGTNSDKAYFIKFLDSYLIASSPQRGMSTLDGAMLFARSQTCESISRTSERSSCREKVAFSKSKRLRPFERISPREGRQESQRPDTDGRLLTEMNCSRICSGP